MAVHFYGVHLREPDVSGSLFYVKKKIPEKKRTGAAFLLGKRGQSSRGPFGQPCHVQDMSGMVISRTPLNPASFSKP